NDLIENSELVSNTITNCRHFDGRERIHVTGREPTESTVPKSWLLFLRNDFVEINIERAQGGTRFLGDPKVEQIIRKMRPRQIFRGEIGNAPRIGTTVTFHAFNGALENAIANGQGEREVEIMFGGNALESAQSVTKIVTKRLFDFVDCNTGSNIGFRFHHVLIEGTGAVSAAHSETIR